MIHDRSLIAEAAAGKLDRAMEAMRNEQAIRLEAETRADRFVHEWQTRSRQLQRLRQDQDYLTAEKVEGRLAEMAHSLERDPQLESLLRSKRPELGLDAMRGKSLSQDLADWLSRSRSRGLGL